MYGDTRSTKHKTCTLFHLTPISSTRRYSNITSNVNTATMKLSHKTVGAWNLNQSAFNPLNAELNPICHLLILLGDLTFTGPCIVSIFQYISSKMQRYTVYLYLETALHVSGGTFTHHQERIHLYLQHLVFVTPLLLSAAISWNPTLPR
jgi:hypothetical protein